MTAGGSVVVLLRNGPGQMDAATTAVRLLTGTSEIVVGVVADDGEAQSILLAISEGSPVVAAAGGTGPVWSRFVRAAGELGRTCRWESTVLAGLSGTQIELLWALGGGLRVPAAARVGVGVGAIGPPPADRGAVAARGSDQQPRRDHGALGRHPVGVSRGPWSGPLVR